MFSIARPAIPLTFLCVAAAILALPGCSESAEPAGPTALPAAENGEATSEAPVFGYETYDALLAEHVDAAGYVDYAGLMKKRAVLDQFVVAMGGVRRAEYEGWSSAEQIAFWINAYNAITLKYILDHYPIEKGGVISGLRYPANSIRQIDGVWDELTSTVVGEAYVLEDIEHEVLRKEFDEPRLHVAIVCASIGCPPLRREAFTGEALETQLAEQSERFLSDPTKFRIDRSQDVVYLSSIFKWFGKDFIGVYGTDTQFRGKSDAMRAVLNYARRYIPEADADYLTNADYTIEYQAYDWSLNER